MTDNLTALDALIEAVEAGRCCTIPSPKCSQPGMTARIMVFAEGYAMMRHKGCMPFVEQTKEVIKFLRAYRAQIGGDA